ncbi:hypothetical protein [Streptomyces acidiscabies]|uniref:hypothetical protein n=1 Tax=Streptomyces acidiscabies TaxID=42234 RepID=UPI00073F8D8B|nr:hypothetical protein [Streptomyces acidiscabies]GAQ51869.1 hypothetical protein a10_01649 [Streptomyces acidiscabies]
MFPFESTLEALEYADPEDERPWHSLRRAFDVVTQVDSALKSHQRERTQRWQSVLAPEISRRFGDGPEPP